MIPSLLRAAPVATTTTTTTPATQQAGAATPKDAARNLVIAFSQPTKEGLRAAVAGKTPAEEKAAEIWAESLAAQFRLQEAVKGKFGDAGYAAFFGRRPSTRPAHEAMIKQVDDAFATAKVEEAGEQARVTLSVGPQTQQIWLTRAADGTWRAWIGAVLQARSPKLIDSYVKFNEDFGRVRGRMADDIEVGKFKTPQEAQEAMGRLEDEEAAKADPAATQQTSTTPEQAQAQIRAQMQQMHDLEAERDRLEKEAATQPIGGK
jgi:hypothetical protein